MLYVVFVMNIVKRHGADSGRNKGRGRVEPIRLGPRLVRKQERRARVIPMPRRIEIAG